MFLKITDFWDQEHIYGPYDRIVWEGDHLHSDTGALLIEIDIDNHSEPPQLEAWCPFESGFYVKLFDIVSSVPDWEERAEFEEKYSLPSW
jgi:hypothetical protein